MKLDFESIIERLTKNLTPAKVLLGIAAVIIIIAIVNFLVNLANMLLPFAIGAVILYFGYQWMTSRNEDQAIKQQMQQQTKTAQTDQQENSVRSVVDAIRSSITGSDDDADADESVTVTVESDQAVTTEDTIGEAEAPAERLKTDDTTEDDDSLANMVINNRHNSMKVPEVVNPKTGLREPDISRLEEQEKQDAEVTDAVLSQLEERRRRLLGEDDS